MGYTILTNPNVFIYDALSSLITKGFSQSFAYLRLEVLPVLALAKLMWFFEPMNKHVPSPGQGKPYSHGFNFSWWLYDLYAIFKESHVIHYNCAMKHSHSANGSFLAAMSCWKLRGNHQPLLGWCPTLKGTSPPLFHSSINSQKLTLPSTISNVAMENLLFIDEFQVNFSLKTSHL